MNYAALSTNIQSFLENRGSEFVSEIPTFVRLAEDLIYKTVQIPALRKNVSGSFSVGNKYLSLPPDFLSAYSLAAVNGGTYSYLLPAETSFIAEATQGALGIPRYYALFDADSALVGPTPDAAYVAELHYFYRPPSIVDTGTSWLGDNAESTLLYGSLVEAYIYMKGEPDLIQMYKARFMESMSRLKNLGEALDKRDNFRRDAPRTEPT